MNRIRANLEKIEGTITSGADREAEAGPDIEFCSRSLYTHTRHMHVCTHAGGLVPFVLFVGLYSRSAFSFRRDTKRIRVSRSKCARIVFPAISRDRYHRCSKVNVVDLCARRG